MSVSRRGPRRCPNAESGKQCILNEGHSGEHVVRFIVGEGAERRAKPERKAKINAFLRSAGHHARKILPKMKGKLVWICGQRFESTDQPDRCWEFQGAFGTEEMASKACVNDNFFIFPATLGEGLPVESSMPRDGYYPTLETKEQGLARMREVKAEVKPAPRRTIPWIDEAVMAEQ